MLTLGFGGGAGDGIPGRAPGSPRAGGGRAASARLLSWLVAGALTLGGGMPLPTEAPPQFRAIALLERRPPGAPPRVRFEWTDRDGAATYLLVGSWTAPGTWLVHRSEFRVTRLNATSWNDRLVTFEVSLPLGSHSWRLTPVRVIDGVERPGEPAQVGFDLR